MGLGIRSLRVGGRYLVYGGNWIRRITAIEGDTIHYVDQFSSGTCKNTTFVKKCYRCLDEGEFPAGALKDDFAERVESEQVPTFDPEATKQLLEVYHHAKTNMLNWFATLEQTAAYHAAVLTPAQKHCVEEIADEIAVFAGRLRQLEDDLAR